MRIWEVRELKFHWTFFLFPVNPTFFLCVFRSGRSFSFHIGLKGQCLEFAGFCGKNTSQRMSQGRFFRQTWKGLTLQTREEHVTTFAYWNDKNDLPAGGLLNEEDLQVGKQGKSSCSPIQSIRELPMRAGKTSVSGVHLPILLCGFPKALFTKNSLRCHAPLAFRGMWLWKRI